MAPSVCSSAKQAKMPELRLTLTLACRVLTARLRLSASQQPRHSEAGSWVATAIFYIQLPQLSCAVDINIALSVDLYVHALRAIEVTLQYWTIEHPETGHSFTPFEFENRHLIVQATNLIPVGDSQDIAELYQGLARRLNQ